MENINSKYAIPKSFKLFGSEIKVEFDNKYNNRLSQYGESDYSTLKISLSETEGVKELPADRIKDCFYHEKVHMILNTMHEDELSNNEKFVDTFAKLLRQSDITAQY